MAGAPTTAEGGGAPPAGPTPMPCTRVTAVQKAYPFGDARAVAQAFPATVSAEEADPFLMCDEFGPMTSKRGPSPDPDKFPIDWHPHRGMDIMTYLKSGRGRHADSLGNREEYDTPGLQWMSCGSGVDHAEGGGTPAGVPQHGFQIWVNVPAARKMDEPRYGTEPPGSIPLVDLAPGARARVIAGALPGRQRGPFSTVQRVEIIDFELAAGAEHVHAVPDGLDCCLVYVYKGGGTVAGEPAAAQHVAVLDAASPAARGAALRAGAGGLHALLFAGARLREPIAWHGPIVMNHPAQIQRAVRELQSGRFPPKRVPWDYRRAAARPRL